MKLIFALLISMGAFAQTIVTDTVHNASGGAATGILYITPSVQFASGSTQIYQVPITVPLNNSGVFTVALYPNDTGVPAQTYYIVQWSLDGPPGFPGQSPTEYWVVPTSGSPVNLATVRSSPQPLPLPPISLAQLTCGSCQIGQVITWSGTSWINGVGGVPCTITAVSTRTCTHNLNSLDVGVDVVDGSGNTVRPARVQVTGVNTVVLTFDAAFTGTAYIK